LNIKERKRERGREREREGEREGERETRRCGKHPRMQGCQEETKNVSAFCTS
jgi:hypothetical protein